MSIPIKVYSDVEFGAGSLALKRDVSITGGKAIAHNGNMSITGALTIDQIYHSTGNIINIHTADTQSGGVRVYGQIYSEGSNAAIYSAGPITTAQYMSAQQYLSTAGIKPYATTLKLGGLGESYTINQEYLINQTTSTIGGYAEIVFNTSSVLKVALSANGTIFQMRADTGNVLESCLIKFKTKTSQTGTYGQSKYWLISPRRPTSSSKPDSLYATIWQEELYVPTNGTLTVKIESVTLMAAYSIGLDSAQGYINLGETRITERDVRSHALYASDVICERSSEYSDRRLKTNITPYQSNRSILTLPIYEYDYIQTGTHAIGCLAQDLQQICPQIVQEGSDGYLTIQESKIVYLLLEEMKKMRLELDELKQNK